MQNSPVKWIRIGETAARDERPAAVTLALGFGDAEEYGDDQVGTVTVTLPNPISWGMIEAIKHGLDLLASGRIQFPEPIPCPQPDDKPRDPAEESAAYEASGGAAVTTERQATGGAAVMPDSDSGEEVVDANE